MGLKGDFPNSLLKLIVVGMTVTSRAVSLMLSVMRLAVSS
jgi:hypothetical protein